MTRRIITGAFFFLFLAAGTALAYAPRPPGLSLSAVSHSSLAADCSPITDHCSLLSSQPAPTAIIQPAPSENPHICGNNCGNNPVNNSDPLGLADKIVQEWNTRFGLLPWNSSESTLYYVIERKGQQSLRMKLGHRQSLENDPQGPLDIFSVGTYSMDNAVVLESVLAQETGHDRIDLDLLKSAADILGWAEIDTTDFAAAIQHIRCALKLAAKNQAMRDAYLKQLWESGYEHGLQEDWGMTLAFGFGAARIAGVGTPLPALQVKQTTLNAAENATRLSVNDKLSRYLLNLDHPVGGDKARWFRDALGFTQNNADDLARQIVFDEAKAVQTMVTQYGTKFNQIIEIAGANGRKIPVKFAWIRGKDEIVRLVTGVPGN